MGICGNAGFIYLFTGRKISEKVYETVVKGREPSADIFLGKDKIMKYLDLGDRSPLSNSIKLPADEKVVCEPYTDGWYFILRP